jgi:hypothetical protein
MKCFSLTLGSRNARKAGRRFSAADDRLVRTVTEAHFPDGFTIVEADGGWFDPKRRKFVKEESRQILVCAPSAARLRPWCRELGRALGQKALLVVEVGPAVTYRIGN